MPQASELLSTLKGPIAVTVAYVLVYYGLIINVLRVRMRLSREYAARGEKLDRYGQDRTLLAADRMQLNTLEHMPPFLLLLWLNAVLVGTFSATVAGGLYVASRIAYPFLVGSKVGRLVKARVMWATYVGYSVITYFALALLWETFGA